MSMSLFEIDRSIREFLDNLPVDEDGCISADALKGLEELQEQRQVKLEAVALYYKEVKAEAEAIKVEADKLSKRATAKANKAERLKEYLKNSMISNGDKDLDTSRVRVIFTPSESVDVFDENALAKKFFTKKVTFTPNKTAIKEALKAGKKVNGAALIEKKNIQIK